MGVHRGGKQKQMPLMKNDSFYRVQMKDGTVYENLTYAETLVYMLPGEWDFVQPMKYRKEESDRDQS
jgi:hypothetical protein